jgi:hypothetical protein
VEALGVDGGRERIAPTPAVRATPSPKPIATPRHPARMFPPPLGFRLFTTESSSSSLSQVSSNLSSSVSFEVSLSTAIPPPSDPTNLNLMQRNITEFFFKYDALLRVKGAERNVIAFLKVVVSTTSL